MQEIIIVNAPRYDRYARRWTRPVISRATREHCAGRCIALHATALWYDSRSPRRAHDRTHKHRSWRYRTPVERNDVMTRADDFTITLIEYHKQHAFCTLCLHRQPPRARKLSRLSSLSSTSTEMNWVNDHLQSVQLQSVRFSSRKLAGKLHVN